MLHDTIPEGLQPVHLPEPEGERVRYLLAVGLHGMNAIMRVWPGVSEVREGRLSFWGREAASDALSPEVLLCPVALVPGIHLWAGKVFTREPSDFLEWRGNWCKPSEHDLQGLCTPFF